MADKVRLAVLLLLSLSTSTRGLVVQNNDRISPLDQFLQVIWEPSSLIRMWVGLDQFLNIARSWRTVAKTLASLPFAEGRSASHVKIQEPRSLKYHKPSVASQWDRFNEIYASSNLSPIVAHARSRHAYATGGSGQLQIHGAFGGDSLGSIASVISQRQLPFNPLAHRGAPMSQNFVGGDHLHQSPTTLFQTRDLFLRPDLTHSLKNMNNLEPWNVEDPMLVSKLFHPSNQKVLQLPGGFADPRSAAPDPGHREKLNEFLRLLRTLGSIHAKEVEPDNLQTSDDPSDDVMPS